MKTAPEVIGAVIDRHLTGTAPNKAPVLISGTTNGAQLVRDSAQSHASTDGFIDLTAGSPTQDLSGKTVYLSATPAELIEALDSIGEREFPQSIKASRDQSRVPQARVEELAKLIEASQSAQSVALVIDISQPYKLSDMNVALSFAEYRQFGSLLTLPQRTSVAFVADQNTDLNVALRNRSTWLAFDDKGELIDAFRDTPKTRLSSTGMETARTLTPDIEHSPHYKGSKP